MVNLTKPLVVVSGILLLGVVFLGVAYWKSNVMGEEARKRVAEIDATNVCLHRTIDQIKADQNRLRIVVLTNTIQVSNSTGAYNAKTIAYDTAPNWMDAVRLYTNRSHN